MNRRGRERRASVDGSAAATHRRVLLPAVRRGLRCLWRASFGRVVRSMSVGGGGTDDRSADRRVGRVLSSAGLVACRAMAASSIGRTAS